MVQPILLDHKQVNTEGRGTSRYHPQLELIMLPSVGHELDKLGVELTVYCKLFLINAMTSLTSSELGLILAPFTAPLVP